MLLWPRLDRAKVRRVGDDPKRIAGIVERRTSQPLEVILAMLTRQASPLAAAYEKAAAYEAAAARIDRYALRIVRSEEGSDISVQDLLPA